MTYKDLLDIKGAVEKLHDIEQSFDVSLKINELYEKLVDALAPWESTYKKFAEKAKALPAEAADELAKINREVEEAALKVVGVNFKGLELKAEDWAGKNLLPKVTFPLFHHGLIVRDKEVKLDIEPIK